MSITAEIKGMKELQVKTEKMVADIHGAPILDAMRDSTLLVQRHARKNAPVDTGRLRASILPEIRNVFNDVHGVVGSNVLYAPYMEFGTRPHFPPISAMETWARRHGTSAFLVARAISRRGTKAILYLTRAFEDNQDAIIKRFDKAIGEVIE